MNETVNLLDCECEPSDEQLAALMKAVAVEARGKAELANRALMATLVEQVRQVRQRYGLSFYPSTIAASPQRAR